VSDVGALSDDDLKALYAQRTTAPAASPAPSAPSSDSSLAQAHSVPGGPLEVTVNRYAGEPIPPPQPNAPVPVVHPSIGTANAQSAPASGPSVAAPKLVSAMSDDELKAAYQARQQPSIPRAQQFTAAFSPSPAGSPDLSGALNVAAANRNPRGSIADPMMQGLTLGFSDEIGGLIGGVQNALKGQSFGQGYEGEKDQIRSDLANYQTRHPWLSTAGEIAGSLPSAMLPLGVAAKGAGLAAKIGRGALAGAGYGATYGAGEADDGVTNRLAGAAAGATSGATIGAALPMAGAAARFVGKPIADFIVARTNPAGFAAQKLADRLAPRGGVDQAANRIANAGDVGQTMSLADVGGRDVQKLARTVANVPGAGGDRIATKINLSAMAQGDRLNRMVGDAFQAPEGAYQAAKATVMDARSNAAAPFYAKANATPMPYTFDLENLLQTPAGKGALAAAKQNSANRREPWAQWFASVDDQGNILDKRRVPDTRALDEVQRVLKGMAEEAKAPADGSPFGKPMATPKSMAIGSVHQDLLKFMDKNNPAYAKARSIALDNIQADEALEFGRNALNTDSRVNAQRMGAPTAYGRDRVLTDGQKEIARFGLADAIRDKIDKSGMTNNALLKFFSTREQVARIRPFFKSQDDFANFRKKIFNEARKRNAINAVRGNSTTASQLADMHDANQLGEVAQIGHQAVMWGPVAAGLGALQRGIHRLGGLTPPVTDHISRMLMTADPATVRGILGTIKKIETRQANKQVRNAQIRNFLTELSAGQAGRAFAPQSNDAMAVQ